MKLRRFSFSLYCIGILSTGAVHAESFSLSSDLQIHLHSPTMEGGNISTDQGGTLYIPSLDLRMQAKKIRYSRGNSVSSFLQGLITAEGDVIVEYKGRTLIAEKLSYDFAKKTGHLEQGRTMIKGWLVAGQEIELLPDGNYIVSQASITTSPMPTPEWTLTAEQVTIDAEQEARFKNIKISFWQKSIHTMASHKVDLSQPFHFPLQPEAKISKLSETQLRLRYRFLPQKHWKNALFFDYNVKSGPGIGAEFAYNKMLEEFYAQNYLARGKTDERKSAHARYRFTGRYTKKSPDKKWWVRLQYDRLSDDSMPSNFKLDSFHEQQPYRTQLFVRYKEQFWLASMLQRVKVNPFESVKQELPALHLDFLPQQMGSSGIITHNHLSANFFDYRFARSLQNTAPSRFQNYHTARMQWHNRFYRPLTFHLGTLTPFVGFDASGYTNSPQRQRRKQVIGSVGFDYRTTFHRQYENHKHIVQPYVNYTFSSKPKYTGQKLYTFEAQDAKSKTNIARIGIANYVYSARAYALPLLSADFYTYYFFHRGQMPSSTPLLYAQLEWRPYERLLYSLNTAWNRAHRRINHLNLGVDYTYSDDLAVGAEFRMRKKYSWRKLDPHNFVLEMLCDEDLLLRSPVCDPRKTVLTRLSYRLAPDWTTKFETKHGFSRRNEPNYYSYCLSFNTQLESQLKLGFAFYHTKIDKFAFTIGIEK